MKHVIISGAGGQVGQAFLKTLSFQEDFSVFSFDRNQLDIADQDKIKRVLQTLPQTQYWINCAAYTKVDDAESNAEAAMLYNTQAPGFIAQACKKSGVHLVHFSSDYVYHNNLRRPLRENDPTEPKGVYAISKWEGEIEIQNISGSHTIIRTSWVYGPGGNNFVNTMLRLGKTKNELSVVGDQLGAPTNTLDIASAVKELILIHASGQPEKVQGIFNYANAGAVTWDLFAKTIFQKAHFSCKVDTITTEQYGAPAPRPSYSVLDCGKIQQLLSSPIPTWEDALNRYLDAVPQ